MSKEDIKNLTDKELLDIYRLLLEEKEYLNNEISKMNEVENEERTTKSL